MLIEQRPGEFVASCEDCGERSAPIDGSREVAVLRLMRTRWRIKTDPRSTLTWCPHCQSMPSLSSLPTMRSPR